MLDFNINIPNFMILFSAYLSFFAIVFGVKKAIDLLK